MVASVIHFYNKQPHMIQFLRVCSKILRFSIEFSKRKDNKTLWFSVKFSKIFEVFLARCACLHCDITWVSLSWIVFKILTIVLVNNQSAFPHKKILDNTQPQKFKRSITTAKKSTSLIESFNAKCICGIVDCKWYSKIIILGIFKCRAVNNVDTSLMSKNRLLWNSFLLNNLASFKYFITKSNILKRKTILL